MQNFCNGACWPPNDWVHPYVCLCVSETILSLLCIAVSMALFFAFGYSSCIKLNDVMLISSQSKQFKATNPD